MLNRMKAEGHRAAARDMKNYGVDFVREMCHTLTLDSHPSAPDPYVEGYRNEFNKTLDNRNRK